MATNTNTTITPGQLGDDLDAHARRCWALSAAIAGLGRTLAVERDAMFEGVDWFARDILLEAKKLADDMRVLSGDDALLKKLKAEA